MGAMKRLALFLTLLLGLALAEAPLANPFDPLFWKKATPKDVQTLFNDLAEGEKAAIPELVKRTDRFGRAALHYAAALSPDPEVVATLIDLGADVNQPDLLKFTPLHYAAAFNENPAVSAVLIEKGADLGARDLEGRTPLHTAAMNQKNPEVVKLLLKKGADKKATDAYGKTPYDYAQENPALQPVLDLLKP